jgi:hypothetical protein
MAKLLVLLVILLGASVGAVADDCSATAQPANRIYTADGDVSAPVIIHAVPIHSTDQSRLANFEGDVLVHVVVDAQGIVDKDYLLGPIGTRLDEEAIKTREAVPTRPPC